MQGRSRVNGLGMREITIQQSISRYNIRFLKLYHVDDDEQQVLTDEVGDGKSPSPTSPIRPPYFIER